MNEILTREKPYKKLKDKGFSNETIFQRICEEHLAITLDSSGQDDYTDRINYIIEDCIQLDPLARPSCSSIRVNYSL